MKTEHDEILRKAIRHYGEQKQKLLTIGEIGELLALVGKLAQGRDASAEWIDEVADVTIMLRQMALIIGTAAVEARIDYKVNRLQEKMQTKPLPTQNRNS